MMSDLANKKVFEINVYITMCSLLISPYPHYFIVINMSSLSKSNTC